MTRCDDDPHGSETAEAGKSSPDGQEEIDKPRSDTEQGWESRSLMPQLRAWAKANGIELPERGRIPTDVVRRFDEEYFGTDQ